MDKSQKIADPLERFRRLVWMSAAALVVAKLVSVVTEVSVPEEQKVRRQQSGELFFNEQPNAVNSQTIALPMVHAFDTSVKEQVVRIKSTQEVGPKVETLRVNPNVGVLHTATVKDDGVLQIQLLFENNSIESKKDQGVSSKMPIKLVNDNKIQNIKYDSGVMRWENLAAGEYVVALRLTGLNEKGQSMDSPKSLSHADCDRPQGASVSEPKVHCALYVKSPVSTERLPENMLKKAQQQYEEQMRQRSIALKGVDAISQIPLKIPLALLIGVFLLNSTGALRLVQKGAYALGLKKSMTVSAPRIK